MNHLSTMMYRSLCLCVAICLLTIRTAVAQTTQPTRPVPAIDRVMIVSIDGCRPDLLLRADTPVIHALLPRASFSFWARTTAESVTLPSHTSMLTGVTPVKHQIQWNKDLPLLHPVYPMYPTLFQLAKKAGYTTALVAGKSKFINLAVPGSLDEQFIPTDEKTTDPDVTDQAVRIITQHRPQVLFVHLPGVDNTGHAKGWASPEQLAALAGADACIGRLLDALKQQHLDGSTFVLITADHGGAGRSHGPDDPRSRHIPWIAFGPGIRQNLDLTTFGPLVIDTEDTFCTACYLLGIPPGKDLDGKPIKEIVERTELLSAN